MGFRILKSLFAHRTLSGLPLTAPAFRFAGIANALSTFHFSLFTFHFSLLNLCKANIFK